MNSVLHSKIVGKGKPLCILHGFLGMSDNWKTLGTAYTEQGFNVHLIDQRNHGRSFHSEEFDYDLLAKDLKTYLNFHKIASTAIIGHSMGGKTAMQFACSYPEMTEKLLIADIAPKFYPPHHHNIITALQSVDLESKTSRNEVDAALKKHLSDVGVRQFLLKNLHRTKDKKLAFRFNLAVLSTKMEEVGDTINSTDHFSGPTLFLRGSKSEYVTEGDATTIHKHFPLATLDTISNAGHWLHAENPKEFLEKSLAFLL
ncbi:alpha/beta fold hydrolase [Maribacter chungangensis]|uniref:Alpha/beta fold hydrolase n=1 Tax=Maribacter chungangensis TaxID=1069117 RepID=A0ABW3B1U9_9FLAO